jgi:hypothetical protein
VTSDHDGRDDNADQWPDDDTGTLRVRDLVGLGAYNVGCLVGGLALGWFVDDRVDSTPVFTLVGLALGIAVGIWGSWLRIRMFLRS